MENKKIFIYLFNVSGKIVQNNKFMKRYQNDINIISYNNKDIIKKLSEGI
jgi:hypothetical protein